MSYGTVKKGDDYYNSSGQKIKVMRIPKQKWVNFKLDY